MIKDIIGYLPEDIQKALRKISILSYGEKYSMDREQGDFMYFLMKIAYNRLDLFKIKSRYGNLIKIFYTDKKDFILLRIDININQLVRMKYISHLEGMEMSDEEKINKIAETFNVDKSIVNIENGVRVVREKQDVFR